MSKNETLKFMAGDTWHREVWIEDPATGNIRSLWDFRIWFTLKREKSDDDVDAVIRKRWMAGESLGLTLATFTSPKTGLVINYGRCPVDMNQPDIARLTFGVIYFWDLQAVSPEGRVMTKHNGTWEIDEEDVTHDTE